MGADDITHLKATSTIGVLLLAGHHHDEGLVFDLFGSWTADDGFYVETVMIAGTQHNITSLLSGRQLAELGKYLDLKDSCLPASRDWASRHRSASTRY